MVGIDAEAEAAIIVARGGYEPGEPADPLRLARALQVRVRSWDFKLLRGKRGLLWWPHGRAKQAEIAIRKGLPAAHVPWVVAHELGEFRLDELGYRSGDVEPLANAIAACILMPRVAFRRAVKTFGLDLPTLAIEHGVDQTATAIRLGEVGIVEAAVVVTPGGVYARAAEAFVLPSEPVLRQAALRGHPQLARHVLTDARRRVALLAG